ncbi:CRISPR-associated protein Cas4 [Nostoc sp.]|uniref:CRISPR-associated protein Cas4 n=1 Tax=Nostoc sp. TaxID=1180 RepID=UPI002FF792FC
MDFHQMSYAHSHQRQLVEISEQLRQSAIATIEAVQTLLLTGAMPKAIKSNRCDGCSLYSHCLPQAVKKVAHYQEVS